MGKPDATLGLRHTETVRATLSTLLPYLRPFWNQPLRDYACAAYEVTAFESQCPERLAAIALLRACVERRALRSGFSAEDSRAASLQVVTAPAIQTGPHCLLLIEPDAFYTHLFSFLGLSAHRRNWHITYQASTVSFVEKAKKGPGWLWLEGEPLNLFGLPRSRMDSSSICGSAGALRFALSNPKGDVAPNASAVRLLAELPSSVFPTAAEAIMAANQELWRRKFPSAKLLQLDDFDMADLVAEHLEDAGSWLSRRFVGDGKFAKHLLGAIDRLNAGPWRGWIRRTTDLFWALEKGRIVPLRLRGQLLQTPLPSEFEIAFDPDSIAAALRRRDLVPSLLTTFLVLSILPGVRVLGGCRQIVYYPLMRFLIACGLGWTGDRHLSHALATDHRPGMWGHRVLKPAAAYPFHEFESRSDLELTAAYGNQPLAQSCGDMASFTNDPVWSELAALIARGTISTVSDEWWWA